jgi:hypothetical protein
MWCLVRPRALDDPIADPDDDQATFGVREADHCVGKLAWPDARTLLVEPLALPPLISSSRARNEKSGADTRI